jgi:hypothetical protein
VVEELHDSVGINMELKKRARAASNEDEMRCLTIPIGTVRAVLRPYWRERGSLELATAMQNAIS